ncbi:MAG: GYD domain-containing protein [Terriglobia bacterium]
MPLYLWQGAYAPEAWAALVEKPENRVAAIRPAIEKLGGKIRSAFFCFGEYDILLLVEMPDNISAAALTMAIAAGGACKAAKTTVLMSPEDGLAAMKKASASGYHPPKLK